MKSILQIATLIVLAVNAASAMTLYWTTQSPGQDAAGRDMATGFLGLTIVAMIAALLLLLASYWTTSWWPAITALIVALLPLVPIILPALT